MVRDARKLAEQDGFSVRTLYKAKEALNLQEVTRGGKKWWELPAGGGA
jgi:hypothetical protein